jgi:hypothetical protein
MIKIDAMIVLGVIKVKDIEASAAMVINTRDLALPESL